MATKKQKQLEEQQRAQSRREITGVCLIAAGLFFAVSVYSDAVGVIGKAISQTFFALFGMLGFTVPVVLFAVGLLVIIFSAKESPKSLSALYVLGILCILVILHVYNKADVENVKLWDYYKEAYRFGLDEHRGGGLIGALLAYPSLHLMGEVGTYILYFTLEIVVILLATRISLRSTGEKVGKSIKSGVENAREYVEARQERIRSSAPVKEESDLFSSDLLHDLMDVPEDRVHGEKRRGTVHRRKKKDRDMEFDLHLDFPMGTEDVGIQDLEKVRYAPEELSYLPRSGEIKRKKESKLEQDIEDVISAFNAPSEPVYVPDDEERRTRISENAPRMPIITIEPPEELPWKAETCEEEPRAEEPLPVVSKNEKKAESVEPPVIGMSEAPIEYQYPPISLLKRRAVKKTGAVDSPESMGKLLVETLASFNISAKIINISVGPVITRFELQPAQGIRVSRITTLSNDIALALAAPRVRIEAPIPGKAAIGIEIPNKNVTSVFLREVLESPEFTQAKSPITFALGKDIAGKTMVADLAKMPHLLIAGATGSGKSVCINGIITSMVYKTSPEELRMILIDPKVVELKVFSSLPHLYLPVVTEPKKAAGALKWAVMEMEQRYQKMSKCNARDLARYNALQANPEDKMPLLVIVIDELADLMMVAAKDVEESICRIAQLGRACGIHLIVATQRPSADIITGLIKANIPSRIAFMVSSAIDSRVIMDCNGAEKLLGKGDMIFHANGADKPVRVQGSYVSDEEVETIMDFFQNQQTAPTFKEDHYMEAVAASAPGAAQGNGKQEDELLPEAVKIVLESGQASISMIQRRLRVGYARAARLIDIMEQHKIVSGFDGSKPRKLLISSFDEFLSMQAEDGGEEVQA